MEIAGGDQAACADSATRPSAASSGARARVLVVEDNPVNRDLVRRMLERLSCTVVAAEDGAAAVAEAIGNSYDLILMDCELPVLDGYQATRRIREQAKAKIASAGRRTAIIALTAHRVSDVLPKCLAAGMDDVLGKPIERAALRESLRRWLPDLHLEATHDGAAAASKGGAIDMAKIAGIRALDRDGSGVLLGRLVRQFATTAPPLVAQIRERSAAADPEALWRAAHSLRSSAAALGAAGLAHRCGEIEAAAKERAAIPSEAGLQSLEHDLQAAINALSDLAGAAA